MMAQNHFSLSWNSFENNITRGLSTFQQNGDFVDMTLAADGHFVKVHQMVVSLASQYLKELITSAPCAHPVLFLNNVSYKALSSLLEYIYSGEVTVSKDNLQEFLEAGKALHIKGLKMLESTNKKSQGNTEKHTEDKVEDATYIPRRSNIKRYPTEKTLKSKLTKFTMQPKTFVNEAKVENIEIEKIPFNKSDYADNDCNNEDILGPRDQNDDAFCDDEHPGDVFDDDEHMSYSEGTAEKLHNATINTGPVISDKSATPSLQYTLSNQGNLQLILNRYMYFLRYSYKNSKPPILLWRCVDYTRNRCPATVTTKQDIVVKRVAAHNHGYHDKRIMKKLRSCVIFTAIKDAKQEGNKLKSKSSNTIEDNVVLENSKANSLEHKNKL